jgi:beta-glucosidase
LHPRRSAQRLATVAACLLAGALLSPALAQQSEAAIERRVEALLKRMTLDEKVGQLNLVSKNYDFTLDKVRNGRAGAVINFAEPREVGELQRLARASRLRIPFIFGLDVLHGVRTMFPLPLAEAATFNPALARYAAEWAGRESASLGVQWTYAPMADLARDPRWGRMIEGFGEDPYLGRIFTHARVEGFRAGGIATAVKHFAGYGAGLGGRDYDATDIAMGDFRDSYLPPFKAAVDAGSESVMAGFNALNGIPATANRWLLTTLLRGEWGFKGFVVSDWEGIPELVYHGVAADRADAARKAINAGLDVDLAGGVYIEHLAAEVKAGRVSMATLDESVRRVLRVKFRMGLFARPDADASQGSALLSPEARKLARQVGRESIVLLQNRDAILPIKPETRSLAVIGALAESGDDQLGPHAARGRSDEVVTLLQGIRERARAANMSVVYEPGCSPDCKSAGGFENAIALARDADAIIAVLGEPQAMSGEAASRASLALAGRQGELLDALIATGRPVVLLLVGGRPLEIGAWLDRVPAVAMTWYLGTEGGHAVADILFGDVSPSGKLPVTWVKSAGQSPFHYNRPQSGRPTDYNNRFTLQYLDVGAEPQFPFGFGLSYTRFAYGKLAMRSAALKTDDTLEVSVEVRNVGDRPGHEAVQLYVRDLVASQARPVRELKAFDKIGLSPGAVRTVTFRVPVRELGFHREDGTYVVEAGEFELYVGGSSLADLSGRFRVTDGLNVAPTKPPAARRAKN